MNEWPLLSRIKKLFSRAKARPSQAPLPIQRIVSALAMTEDAELACDEVFELLDQFAEMEAAGQNPAAYFPLVEKHLHKCVDCREEYEAILAMLAMNGQLAAQPP